MKLSRTEANWFASKLLSDAERQREDGAGRRTAWLVFLFPALRFVRPTERVAALRGARLRAARDRAIMVPSVAGLVLSIAMYVGIPQASRPGWLGLLPAAIVIANLLARYVRARVILRAAAR